MKLWLLMSAVVSILVTFNAHAINNCQELMRVIRHVEFEPPIIKVMDYNVLEFGRPVLEYWIGTGRLGAGVHDMTNLLLEHPLTGSVRRLYCYSDVRYSDGTSGSVQYVLDRDPDGEQYWQLADFDRTEWREWVDALKTQVKDLDPKRPWYRTWVTSQLVQGSKPICPGCTATIPERVYETHYATKPSDWIDIPKF